MSQHFSTATLADGRGEMPALEMLCEACGGKGMIDPHRVGNTIHSGGQCEQCGGAGSIATDDGKRLKSFLARHCSFPR